MRVAAFETSYLDFVGGDEQTDLVVGLPQRAVAQMHRWLDLVIRREGERGRLVPVVNPQFEPPAVIGTRLHDGHHVFLVERTPVRDSLALLRLQSKHTRRILRMIVGIDNAVRVERRNGGYHGLVHQSGDKLVVCLVFQNATEMFASRCGVI